MELIPWGLRSSPPSAQGHKRGWGCSPAMVNRLLRNYYNSINISLQFQEKLLWLKTHPGAESCLLAARTVQWGISTICLEETELTFLYSVTSVTSFYVSVFEFLIAANILRKPLYYLNLRKAIAIQKQLKTSLPSSRATPPSLHFHSLLPGWATSCSCAPLTCLFPNSSVARGFTLPPFPFQPELFP